MQATAKAIESAGVADRVGETTFIKHDRAAELISEFLTEQREDSGSTVVYRGLHPGLGSLTVVLPISGDCVLLRF